MPGLQRLQRVQAYTGATSGADPSAFVGGEGLGRRRSDASGAACSVALLLADVLAFGIAAIIAGLAGAAFDESFGSVGTNDTMPVAAILGSIVAGMAGYFSMHEHYTHRLPFWAECREIVLATGCALVFAAAFAFLLACPLPRVSLLGTALLFPPSVIALRRLTRSALDSAGVWRIPVVVVGAGSWAEQAVSDIGAHGELGYDVVAQAPLPSQAFGVACWRRVLRQSHARMLILALDGEGRLPPELIASLVRERVPYALLPQMTGLPMVGARQTFLGEEAVLLSYRNNLRKPVARGVKIAFDLVAAGAALIVLAPVMLLIAALVGLDGGPVFFSHKRIGAGGRVFHCLKFRSMVTDSEAVLKRVLATDPVAAEEWARTQKLRRDPRVTWIGRVLRKTSLDELPQLINVLRLEMSLVGPRPIVSLEVPKYAEDIAYYYETRPGITGLWQVSGRSDTTYAQRVRLDSYYVKNWTLWQDVSILARTIPAVVSGRGAG